MAAKANYSKKPENKKKVTEKKEVVKMEAKPVETKQETASAETSAAKTTKAEAKKETKSGAKRGPKPEQTWTETRSKRGQTGIGAHDRNDSAVW